MKEETKCICACHDTEFNSMKKHAPVKHDKECCSEMNGTLSKQEDICKKHGVVHRNGGYASCKYKQESSWQERFDKEFVDSNFWEENGGETKFVGIGNIKSFIQKEIDKAKEEAEFELKKLQDITAYSEGCIQTLEVLLEEVEKLNKRRIYMILKYDSDEESYWNLSTYGYKSALSDIAQIIKSKLEK